jgi:putative endonuclease
VVTSRRRLGDFGERVAAHRLESLGMRIIERNVRIGRTEVDLIAEDGGELAFVEVRTRRGEQTAAAESITGVKLRRLWLFAMRYCEANEIPPERARIDIVSLDLDERGIAREVLHFRGMEIPEGPED